MSERAERSPGDSGSATDTSGRSPGDSGSATGGLLAGLGDRTVPALALFAVGQVVVTAALPAGALPATVVVEAVLVGLLLVPLARGPAPIPAVGTFLIALAGLGGLAWGTFVLTDSLWLVALVLAAVAAPVAYYLHRYARVVAGRYGEVPPAR